MTRVALVAWICLGAVAAQAQVLPPGHEAEFQRLLGDLPNGWSVIGIEIGGEKVSYRLARGEEEARLDLTAPASRPPAFLVHVEGADAEILRAHARAQIDARREFDPWIDPQSATSTEGEDTGRETPRPLYYGALALVLALGWCALAVRRRNLACAVAGLGTLLIVAWGWAADDAFITYRYVAQALDGQGLVFNPGERVQGFTHPLWVLLLLAPSMLLTPFDASMLLAIGCTTGLFAVMLAIARARDRSPLAVVTTLVLLLGSETFVAFQTSGLENSLSHLLLALVFFGAITDRTRTIAIGAALLILTRLDLALLVLPVVLGAIRDLGGLRAAWRRERAGIAIGVALLLAWFGFAAIYYGFALPNTFYAKTGEGWPIARGLRYLASFAWHEPLGAAILVVGCAGCFGTRVPKVGAWFSEESPVLRRVGIGTLLYLAYVVYVGGDYMHGRFVAAPLIAASLGLPSLRAVATPKALAGGTVIAALAFVFTGRSAEGEIVNERTYHRESQLLHIGDGHVTSHRGPAEELPNVAIGGRVMASAFTDDPRFIWIDAHGLVDPFVARCPARPNARAGHVERFVPRAYFEARRDVGLADDGEARLRRGDLSLEEELSAMTPAWPTPALEARYREIQLLVRGPILDAERLQLVPAYTFSAQRIEVPDNAEFYDPP
ncbi:MAG: hypothetical protein AAGE52_01660 [Myxococcota bacterium]